MGGVSMSLTLDDVVLDAFRREFLVLAFPDEQAVLARRLALLSLVRHFKTLVGRRDALLHLAQEISSTYLAPLPASEGVDEDECELELLGERVRRLVAAGRAPLDMFAGVERLVRARLARDHFPRFVASPQYSRLCEALRARREMPLAELLVDARRTEFLEEFLRETAPASAGNLRFWVDVQTTFLPLLQVTIFSSALFEQVQRAVRRLFNQYCADSSPLVATRVPESVRKETLAKIMQMQGEPFSPPRYANLFRAAQDCVWQWLQSDIYPRFRASDHYIRLIVETENLEADRQLRRLSEHVRSFSSSDAVRRNKSEPQPIGGAKLGTPSTIVVPISSSLTTHPSVAQLLELQSSRLAFDRSLLLLDPAEKSAILDQIDSVAIHAIAFYSLIPAELAYSPEDRQQAKRPAWRAKGALFCSMSASELAAETHPTFQEYCWNRSTSNMPSFPVSPTGARSSLYTTAPQPVFHNFVVPDKGNSVLHGTCLTQWKFYESEDSDNGEPGWRPCVSTLITRKPMWHKGRELLARLESIELSNVSASDINQTVITTLCTDNEPIERMRLDTRFSGFYLQESVCSEDFPVNSALRDINTQTFLAMLGCLLVGKSIILVSEEPSTLTLIGEALRVLMQPFHWQHTYLPFCPFEMASSVSALEDFKEGGKPFLIGFDAILNIQKPKDDYRYRLRNSIYSVQKASLELQLPPQRGSSTSIESPSPQVYPSRFLETQAIVVDLDSNDVYVPERTEIPEFPQSLVRAFESILSEAIRTPSINDADSFVFGESQHGSSFASMLTNQSTVGLALSPALGVRLAVMNFLEALLGDTVYHFCSFHPNLAGSKDREQSEAYILFEADSFLDARIELGCRDFFRQCFQTEAFRGFLIAQHQQFVWAGRSNE